MHAINALLMTGPVGLGDTCVGTICMTNATLVRRLARADGVLLRPDKPLTPMDVMWGALVHPTPTATSTQVRAMPYFCTPAQEAQGANASCGARLWQTHATIAEENAAMAPELAKAPTRRLVSHSGVDAAAWATVPAALAAAPNHLMQHLIVSVDQQEDFIIQVKDLYPLPANVLDPASVKHVMYRSATLSTGGGKGAGCTPGADAVASGCVAMVTSTAGHPAYNTPLFDVSTKDAQCSQGAGVDPTTGANYCFHSVGMWQVWVVDGADDLVVLGDLSAYVSLSGYRFRLPVGAAAAAAAAAAAGAGASPGVRVTQLIAVGLPDEVVTLTYLRNNGGKWIVHTQAVTIEADGRSLFTLL